jgi:hypothetical protein
VKEIWDGLNPATPEQRKYNGQSKKVDSQSEDVSLYYYENSGCQPELQTVKNRNGLLDALLVRRRYGRNVRRWERRVKIIKKRTKRNKEIMQNRSL